MVKKYSEELALEDPRFDVEICRARDLRKIYEGNKKAEQSSKKDKKVQSKSLQEEGNGEDGS